MQRQHYITPHQSNSNFLRHKTPDFISSRKCTPHSTDLNPDSLFSLGYLGKTCLCLWRNV